MMYLKLTPDQFKVLFDMIVLCIASTERSPERDEMVEVQRTIQMQVAGEHADPAAIW